MLCSLLCAWGSVRYILGGALCANVLPVMIYTDLVYARDLFAGVPNAQMVLLSVTLTCRLVGPVCVVFDQFSHALGSH